jgi:N-methylhydantoinase B
MNQDGPRALDPVSLSIIHNNLVNICREMGTAMMKTAYSPIFNEGLDFSCVIFDRDGEMIAQAEFCPAQLGAILYTVRWCIAELGLESFEEGDVVIHNDPYRGGCHMPEHMVLKPVFYRGELFGFVANIAHVAEIGGMAVGSFAATATEVYQEGLRLPPVKIMRRGEYVRDLWRVILANHRTPNNTWGDFHAMIGSLHIAERRLLGLLDRYGVAYVRTATQALIEHAERWMREEIRRIPDGEYVFEDCMEDDGATANPTFIRAKIVVRDDELIADFSASDRQARGIVNATYGVTASATYNAVFHLTDKNIPHNSGCYRPITIIAPPGSVVNVQHPAPSVAGNTETHPRLVDIVIGALAQAVPDRVQAAEGGTSCNFLFGGTHPETGQFYANYQFEGCGWGGRNDADGNNAVVVPNGNCRNTPVEVYETRYPFRTLSYRLVPGSAGPGRHRGGLGTERIVEVVPPAEITVSAVFERMRVHPWGIFGGGPATGSAILLKRSGDDRFRTFQEVFGTVSPAKFANCVVQPGDQILLRSPGGGGYGPPSERDPEMVRHDVEQGFVSPDEAREVYRVALRTLAGRMRFEVDRTETARRRAAVAVIG